MKNVKRTILAVLIALGSSFVLTGCFVDADEEVFDTVESTSNEGTTASSSNDGRF